MPSDSSFLGRNIQDLGEIMARADLILTLVRAGSEGNETLFTRTVEAMIAEERAKQHHTLADSLEKYLHASKNSNGHGQIKPDRRLTDFLIETFPHRGIADLILSEDVRGVCQEIIEEHNRSDLLRSYGLEPRHRVMLVGPPGNGKTSLAEALAYELMLPLFTIRYESVIGSYLGETAGRLRQVFDFIKTHNCVLFFDEFDTLGKERGDTHETGEIKRVVSSLLLQIDSLPSHVIVVVATNHAELLDRAVWRRFQVRLFLPLPSEEQLAKWLQIFEARIGKKLGLSPKAIAPKLLGLSFAEVEEFGAAIMRRYILSLPQENIKSIVAGALKQLAGQVQPTEPHRPLADS